MKRLLVICAAAGLSACATADRINETSFTPTPDRQNFTFSAMGTAFAPHDTPAGEAYRMGLLADWLKPNGMCSAGYEITSRDAVIEGHGILGTRARVNYTGRCRPAP